MTQKIESLDLDKLTPKQEKFCRLYTTNRDYFGNGTQAYLESYGTDKKPVAYNTARVEASKLLTKPNIIARIQELLELAGLNDADVDKELSFLIHQHRDLSVKLGAIREYNVIKRRITQKIEYSEDKPSFGILSDKRVVEATEKYEEELKKVMVEGV